MTTKQHNEPDLTAQPQTPVLPMPREQRATPLLASLELPEPDQVVSVKCDCARWITKQENVPEPPSESLSFWVEGPPLSEAPHVPGLDMTGVTGLAFYTNDTDHKIDGYSWRATWKRNDDGSLSLA
jgi:hypothetical protein